jgi:hypothetical protein
MWGELPGPIRWIPLPLSPAEKTAGCIGLRVKTRVALALAGRSSAQARPSREIVPARPIFAIRRCYPPPGQRGPLSYQPYFAQGYRQIRY